tara:strand:- start:891 stop:2204 length:1314 start_codon:yes stop_codon:yes gene_type:complete
MAYGQGRFRRGPSFDDRATGKFSGSPAGYSRDTGPSFSDVATGKFSGSPRGYPTPSNRQPGFGIANTRVAQGRGLGDRIGNVARNVGQRAANVGRGMMHPFAMAAGSIANNRAQHAYLDEVYGKDKGAAQWDQAINQFYDRGLYGPGSDEPLKNVIGMSFGDIEPGGGGTLGGVSFGQANKYLNAAGVTDQALQKYIKEGKSDAWLRAQAGGGKREQEDFNTAMSFIKNAKATANLARSTAAAGMENEMYGGRTLGGPSFDDAATRVRSYPEDAGGYTGEYSDPDEIFEDITADIAPSLYDVTTGYDRDKIYDFERQRPKTTFRNRFTGRRHDPYDLVGTPTFPFSEENMAGDYTAGYPGMDVMNQITPEESIYHRDRNVGTRGAAGSFDELYMNRIGDVINRGPRHIVPNISVEFGEQEEETPFGKYNPRFVNRGR